MSQGRSTGAAQAFHRDVTLGPSGLVHKDSLSLSHTLSQKQGITTIIARMATVHWELTMRLDST